MALSAASITAQIVGPNALGKIVNLAAVLQAAQAGGDAFSCKGKEVIMVRNASGGTITVTVKSVADNFGNVYSTDDITLAIPAGDVGIIGPLQASKYADPGGLAQLTYSAVTTLTIGVFTFSVTS